MGNNQDARSSPLKFLSFPTVIPPATRPTPPGGPLRGWPLFLIFATAILVVLPFWFLGNPSGHDFEFHLNSWMEVMQQWHQGILYPRWAASSYDGYGEARFLFYPPASWTLGAILGALLPWAAAPAAYIWVALTLSGCSMFLLAKRWLQARDAAFAAALYAANPYYLVIVYWRSAFAELLAGALLPLLLLYLLRAETEGRKVVLPLSLIVAAAWLTNAPSAVMVVYSLAILAFVVAAARRAPRVLCYAGIALAAGLALAAFYVLPAAYEQKWVNIAAVLSPGVRPQDNFLFAIISDPDHNRFNLLVSLVAVAEIVALAGAVGLSRWRANNAAAPSSHPLDSSPEVSFLRLSLLVWAAVAAVLMFSVTIPAWDYLPQMRYLQLPWRWLLCLNVVFALMITLAWRRWLPRLLLCGLMLTVIVLVWHRVQPPWWDSAAAIAEMRDHIIEGPGYEGTDEYVPAGADPYEIEPNARRATFEGEGQARIQVQRWDAESKLVSAAVNTPGKLVLRLFNYPAWKVSVNGRLVAAESREVTGQMMVPLDAGENCIQVKFTRTWDRTIGGVISLLSALALFLWRRLQRQALV